MERTFRQKLPEVVTALQITEATIERAAAWTKGYHNLDRRLAGPVQLTVPTEKGILFLNEGDYLVQRRGEFAKLDPSGFESQHWNLIDVIIDESSIEISRTLGYRIGRMDAMGERDNAARVHNEWAAFRRRMTETPFMQSALKAFESGYDDGFSIENRFD